MIWNYEATRKGYAKMWDSITIKGGRDATNANYFAKLIIKGEDKYKAVEAATGWPWYFVGAIHMRESGCDFKGVLHNGEKIIGTKRKTKLVPAGRGPFKTWADAAVDAIHMKLSVYAGRTWCPALMGFVSEYYNGLGNIAKGVNSAYLWAGSNHEQLGKYVRDHVFDKNFDDPQIGTMTVIKALCALRQDIADDMALNHVSPQPLLSKKNVTIAGGSVGGVATVAAAASDTSSTMDQFQPFVDMMQNHGTTIALIFTVVVIIGGVAWHFYEKSTSAEASS